ncbi:MAG: MFS transporter [Tistlia sp.]|uniref:MFS transporter n=1 Tax=Tistlia sp. TaxID=3057121 RepID=UPI0034A1A003
MTVPSGPAAARGGGTALPWIVWGLGATLFCYGFFQRVAPSVMVDSLMRDFQVGGALLGGLSAFYFYAYAGLQIPVGLLVDRYGPRRMLALGAGLCGLGSLVFGLSEQVELAYLGRLLIGAGAGFSFVGTLKLATLWFAPQRFAQLAGMTMMLGMLGGILGQAPLAALVEAFGWRGTMLVAGGAGGLLALAIWLVVRDSGLAGPAEGAPPPRAGAGELWSGIVRVLGNRQLWVMTLIAAAMSAPMLTVAGLWGVPWLMHVHGYARSEAAGTNSLLLIGWAVGSPLAGILSDRLGRRRLPLLLGALLGLVCLVALLYLPGLPGALLSALFFLAGVGMGCMAITYAMARESVPASDAGTAMALVNTATVGSGALFQPLVGWLLDLGWDGELEAGARVYGAGAYDVALGTLAALLAVGLLAGLLLRDTGPATA